MFERCLYFNINALARAVNRIWDEAFAEFDLSPSHAYLLRLVLSEPGLTPKQITQILKLEKSTVTRFMDALAKKELLIRKSNPNNDGRQQSIYPTKKAEAMASQLEEKGSLLYQSMISTVGKNELTTLVKELRQTESMIK